MAVACLKQIQTHTVQRKLVNFMTSRQAKLQEDTYFRVMRILQENPDLTQRELALSIGVGERFIVELEAGKATAQLGKALAAAKAAGMHLTDAAEL